jgi:TRAP-type C4-dicarboxylate transport system permease large subunit
MTYLGTLGRIAVLAALGYLGFYVYGLMMGVFTPMQTVGFSVVAALCLTVFAVYSVRYRRAMKDPSKQAAMMRQAHVYRERRGF